MRSFSTSEASQKGESWANKMQEKQLENMQREMKLRDIPPSLSQLIQVLRKRMKRHQQTK
jgi:hypothetical protein